MRIFRLFLIFVLALPLGAFAQGKLNVVTTTEDLERWRARLAATRCR